MTTTAIRYLYGTTPSLVVPIVDTKGNPLDLSGEATLTLSIVRKLYEQEIVVDTLVLTSTPSWTRGEVVVVPPGALQADRVYIYHITTSSGVKLLTSTIQASSNPAAIKDCCAALSADAKLSTTEIALSKEDGLFDVDGCCVFKELDLQSSDAPAYLKYTGYTTDYTRNSLGFETPVLPLNAHILRTLKSNLKTDAASYHFSLDVSSVLEGKAFYTSSLILTLAKIGVSTYPTISPWELKIVRKFSSLDNSPAQDQTTVTLYCDGVIEDTHDYVGASAARVYVSVDYDAKVIAVKTALRTVTKSFSTVYFGQDVVLQHSLDASGEATSTLKDVIAIVPPSLPWEDQSGFPNIPLGIKYGSFLPTIGARYWVSSSGTLNNLAYIAPDIYGNAEALLVIQKYPLKVTKIGRYSVGAADDIVQGGDGLEEDRSVPGELTLNVVERVKTVTGIGRIEVDNTDPTNPVISYLGGTGGPGEYRVETQVSAGQTVFTLTTISAEFALVFIGGVFTPTGFTVDALLNEVTFSTSIPSGVEINFLEVSKGNAVNGVPTTGATGQHLVKDTSLPEGCKWVTYTPPTPVFSNMWHGFGIQLDRQGNLVPNTLDGKGYLDLGLGLTEVTATSADLTGLVSGVVYFLVYRTWPTPAVVPSLDSVAVLNGRLVSNLMGYPVLGLVYKVPSNWSAIWAPQNTLLVRSLYNDVGTLNNPVQPIPGLQSLSTLTTYQDPRNVGTTRVYAGITTLEYPVPMSPDPAYLASVCGLPVLAFPAERLELKVEAGVRTAANGAKVLTQIIQGTFNDGSTSTSSIGFNYMYNSAVTAGGTITRRAEVTGLADTDLSNPRAYTFSPMFTTPALGQAVVFTDTMYTEVFHSGVHKYSAYVRK